MDEYEIQQYEEDYGFNNFERIGQQRGPRNNPSQIKREFKKHEMKSRQTIEKIFLKEKD